MSKIIEEIQSLRKLIEEPEHNLKLFNKPQKSDKQKVYELITVYYVRNISSEPKIQEYFPVLDLDNLENALQEYVIDNSSPAPEDDTEFNVWNNEIHQEAARLQAIVAKKYRIL